MPNIRRNFIVKFSIIFILILQSFNCQADNEKLIFADSLFSAQSYQEAFEVYTDLLQKDQSYSPAMLLKMAYITEGMGDYAQASLYLSKYYDLHPNPKVISKIKALTDQRELKGYAVSDRTQFFNLLIDYKEIITGIFALLLVISIILLIAKKKTGQVKYYTPAFMLIILVFASNNLLMASKSGIIKDSPTIIMDSPTAAGQLIKKVNPGHRVIIKSKKDIWYEIEWEGAEAWVKQSAVSTL